MSIWLIYMLLASFTMMIHISSVKALGLEISPVFTATIFLVIGAITTSLIYVFSPDKPNYSELFDLKVIVLCILAGVSIGFTDYFVASSYANNAPLTLGYPIFATASAILLGIIGILIFKEVLSVTRAAGVVLSLVGIYLISQK